MVPVALSRRREQELVRVFERLGNHRHRRRVNAAGQPAVHHLMEVTQEAESGHVRAGVDVIAAAAGGALGAAEAEDLLAELRSAGVAAAVVGEILERQEPEILVTTA